MIALWRQVPRIRAERQLDAARAAAYPYMDSEGRKEFNAHIMDILNEQQHQAADWASLRINGKGMSIGAFKANMSKLLGAGFSG